MAPKQYIMGGRKVPASDVVLTLTVSAFEGCGPFVEANRSRLNQSSSSALLDRRQRAGTEECDLSFTIVLPFSNPPGQSRSQFVIGRSPECSDVVCTSRTVSNQHIKFAVEDDHVVLYDVSGRGSKLALGGRGEQWTWRPEQSEQSIPYRCILPRGCLITLTLHGGVSFEIEVPSFTGPELEVFRRKRDAFFANCSDLGALSIASQVPTQSATPAHSAHKGRQYMYWFEKKLGRGSHGAVYMVRRLQDWAVFAAKQLVGSSPGSHSMSNPGAQKKVSSEINNGVLREEMEKIKGFETHRIVRYMDWYQDVPGRWILVMEYFQHGSLEQMMKDRKVPFKKSEIAEILKQAAEGLRVIHGQHITHRDLKPDNILLRSKKPLSLALADFGLADRKSESRSYMETICGTAPYMAPEMWEASYTKAVDIWALGVVGFALINKGLPRPPGNRPPNYSKFVFDEIENMSDRDPKDRLVANIRKMLAEDPRDRLPAEECIEDADELLELLRTNEIQDGQYSGRSSREPRNQTFGSSEIRAIEEKDFQTSNFRAAVAAAAESKPPGQNPTQKRGTDALPRSNSLEAPLPKAPRTKTRDHLKQKGTGVPQRPSNLLATEGHSLPGKKATTSVLPQLRPTNVHVQRTEQPAALAQKRAAGHQLRSESPSSAPRNPPFAEKPARRIPPSVEGDERPGQKGQTGRGAPPPAARPSNATGAAARAKGDNGTQNNSRK